MRAAPLAAQAWRRSSLTRPPCTPAHTAVLPYVDNAARSCQRHIHPPLPDQPRPPCTPPPWLMHPQPPPTLPAARPPARLPPARLHRYKEVVETVLLFRDSKDKQIRRAVMVLLPRVAAFSPERFAAEYLSRALTYLIAVLKHQPERCGAALPAPCRGQLDARDTLGPPGSHTSSLPPPLLAPSSPSPPCPTPTHTPNAPSAATPSHAGAPRPPPLPRWSPHFFQQGFLNYSNPHQSYHFLS